MGGLALIATAVSMDEPCYAVAETNMQSPGYRGFHRFRIITVIRNDRKANYTEDLGPVALWPGAHEFNLIGGVTNENTGKIEVFSTVGEMMDGIDLIRSGKAGQPPEFEPSDLIGRWLADFEEQERRRRRASSFGASVAIQRG